MWTKAARRFLGRFLPCCRQEVGGRGSHISDPLHSYRAKIARAQEHFDALQSSLRAFTDDPEAYSVTKEVHAKNGLYIFRLKVHRKPPMTAWALMLGDCIHNLRSALDHFFWVLVVRHHNGSEPEGLYEAAFPLSRSRKKFDQKKVHELVGEPAATILERLQPYHAPRYSDATLGFLHNADIRDKHRLLVEQFALVQEGTSRLEHKKGHPVPVVRRNVIYQTSLHDDAVIATFVVQPPDSIVDMHLEGIRLGLAFNRGEGRILFVENGLAQMFEEVRALPRHFPDLAISH